MLIIYDILYTHAGSLSSLCKALPKFSCVRSKYGTRIAMPRYWARSEFPIWSPKTGKANIGIPW